MTAAELYRSGKLDEAIKALGDEVRANPLDTRRRTFLFELLCFAGNFDRADKQLDFLASVSADAAAGALLYRSALQAERTRADLFLQGKYPEGDVVVPAGERDDAAFHELQDADPRIGANLEVYIAGSYTWIPLKYMEELRIEPPKNLRDLLWARAEIKTTSAFRLQDLGEVLLPVLAPLSFQNADDAVRLGRATVWKANIDGTELPAGQRMLLIDGQEVPLLEVRTVRWNQTAKGASDASA